MLHNFAPGGEKVWLGYQFKIPLYVTWMHWSSFCQLSKQVWIKTKKVKYEEEKRKETGKREKKKKKKE